MQSITLQDAQTRLAEIIATLPPGEEVVITRDLKPVATIRAAAVSEKRPLRQLGTLQGTVQSIAPDFDAIPDGFEEYTD